jgi:hypothetical protein
MTPQTQPVFHAVDRGLLCCASFLVPGRQRAEWLQEWESELWHARRSHGVLRTASWRTERQMAGFCCGAFQDAACLRRLWWQNRPRFAPLHGSAPLCLFRLGSLLLASYLFSILLPGVRAERDFSSQPVRPGTILIQDDAAKDSSAPSMTIAQLRTWDRGGHHYIDGFAFYRVAKEAFEFGSHRSGTWQVAQASSNLFTLAGWSLRNMIPRDEARRDVAHLVLSERVWRQQFGADPEIAGTVLHLGSRQAQVVGVAPEDAGRLPGHTDAWLLESDSAIDAEGPGYALAHLTRSGRSQLWGGLVPIISYDGHRSAHDFLGKSLEEQLPPPASIYWFGILLALLSLPAIASVSLAEYNFSSHKPSWIRRAARLAFLGAKIALILLIAYFSSEDLAYWHASVFSPWAVYIQLIASFAICLLGMRWALLDQRQRCPVCLRRVAHPAQVGSPSRMFLAWSGTELICTGGHALLHVPGLPTSWFGTQRWMYLDSSWDFLFAC